MGRSAIYFHFPERITPACTSFDALYFYIAGFYVIEEKILFPGFPRLDMIYVLPMLSIVGYLYFIFFAIGCFPVQTDTINIDRLLQVDIEPFIVTGLARPAGTFVAVCDIFRSSVLCRRNDYRFVLGDIGYMLIKRNRKAMSGCVGISGYFLTTAQGFDLAAVTIINGNFGGEMFLVTRSGIDHFYGVGERVPLNVQRFTGFTRSPESSGQVIIIIVGLPYHRRIGRLSHPGHDARGIFPHVVEPAFIHGLVGFDIQQLCFPAVFFDIFRFPIAFGDGCIVLIRGGIECPGTEKMLIPHFIAGPLFIGRHEFPEAFVVLEYRCSDFCTESPAGSSAEAGRVSGKIPAGIMISP